MRIYTKYGDKGFTRLYGGDRVSKTHIRVEAYGTMDELCSFLGYLTAEMKQYEVLNDLTEECEEIQQHLFDCGSDLATPRELRPYKQKIEDVTFLEEKIDAYMGIPPKLEHFIIPGGHSLAGLFHMARTMTRRLERCIVAVIEADEAVNEIGLQYINRLSDYFFVIARLVNYRLGVADKNYIRSAKIFRSKKQEEDKDVSSHDEH
ncbi:cob(I)yrinic acid a,c-diamide adenosyltransferase [Granulicatella sp. zg-ZJ]|uniref:cob(I)yrinic acid a,c-diamide adenosyltransferase n=1 Tax=unclassified Granulicatella TaxID=2630493 RepID=UPI0013C20A6D|nr:MULTISPECIES: cob(I)yrinic acid a,c-diamide adenosyltransferase [unclassified Granulicatella]MBS4749702.1 cob(I)yrinic acid a,c-diamide adenosyltransferase [Carnobacteriaceae bacterium zg-ZUI78]NEW61831.1 cob(I)yrinic acid a,c-diamide adenosyltransferase [Granulicatella sp. zg-ZJ]NEW65905.1 cob(I)yrinic acid a,c-diamide adenosyltransferase [Granulicatella sp. zg-84]QMI85134.1 cob(I)yrinic acid a,c-diamide adenosyltransferase [Carnobacteriaceae bacterium zg-84]